MKNVSKYIKCKKIDKRIFVFFTLIVIFLVSSVSCNVLPVKDSVQNSTKAYIGEVLSESFKKSKEDFPGKDEKTRIKYQKYLQNQFGKYFTKSGYEMFEKEKIFESRLQYFREKNIQKILNVIITVIPSKGSNEKESRINYDYTIEYYAIDKDNVSEKIIDKGVLEVIKQNAGNYIIDSDYTNYSTLFSQT